MKEEVRLYRGKPVNKIDREFYGRWVTGYYCPKKKGCVLVPAIICADILSADKVYAHVEIVPETLGQYTGVLDNYGRELFEGDLVMYYEDNHDNEDGPGQIMWDDGTARFIIVFDGLTIDFSDCQPYQLEKVGNIHDNPEWWYGTPEWWRGIMEE